MIQRNSKAEVGFPLRNNSAISIIPKSSSSAQGTRPLPKQSAGPGYRPFSDKETVKRSRPIATATAKPYLSQVNLTNQVSLSRLPKIKQEPVDHGSIGDNSNSSDGPLRTDQRVEEVRLEDVVAEVTSNEYSRPNRPLSASVDSSSQKSLEGKSQTYPTDNISCVQSVQTQRVQQPEPSSKMDKPVSLPESKEVSKTDSSSVFENNFLNQSQVKNTINNEISAEEPHSTIPPPIQSQPPSTQRNIEVPNAIKNLSDSSNSPTASVSVSAGASTPLAGMEQSVLDVPQPDPHGVPQGYPYAQYPRYYDYADPRSRSLGTPYGSYYPGVPPHSTNPRQSAVGVKPQSQPDLTKPVEDTTMINKAASYPPAANTSVKPTVDVVEPKASETATTTAASATTSSIRNEGHTSTAFTHPTAGRYPAPYPPAPYDPYAQHYPPAPGSSATYPPGGKFEKKYIFQM